MLWFSAPHMPPEAPPSQSAEDYLERIHELIEEKGYARVVDIASSLAVKQASVNYAKYRGLNLTDKGRAVASFFERNPDVMEAFVRSRKNQ